MANAEYDTLRDAIEAKSRVQCMYQGHVRKMCPHVIGTKEGKLKVLSYQFGGSSSSPLPADGQWKCMFVDQISDVEIVEGEWRTSENHSQKQTCVDEIDLEVDY